MRFFADDERALPGMTAGRLNRGTPPDAPRIAQRDVPAAVLRSPPPQTTMMRSVSMFGTILISAAFGAGNAVPERAAARYWTGQPASPRAENRDSTAEPANRNPQVIVIGFVGGFVRH